MQYQDSGGKIGDEIMIANRIVLDARCLRGTPGGVVSYTKALVEHLPLLLPNVPIVLLRHRDRLNALSRAPNVSEWSRGGGPNDVWNYFQLRCWLNRRIGPKDLFHAPYRVLPRGIQAKSVITIHDVMHVVCPELVFPNPLIRPFQKTYWSFIIRDSLRRADRIIAVSHYSANDAAQIDPACRPRLRVTHLGKSPTFRPIMKESAERLSSSIVPPGKRFFLVVGGGYPNKNHVRAVSAFGKAFKAFDNMHLLVIERNRRSPPELRQAVRRTQLPERIIIRDSVAAEELVALYNRAEALVFPSLYEGFGLPILEAMACGCPVLCSNTTAPPEVAGDAALLLPPNDDAAIAAAMRRIVEDPALQQSLSERGIRHATLFDWQKMAAETVRLYAEIAPWIPAPTLTANLSTR